MAIDPYSNCPCGSGKKIKFCCRDLAPEIEKIERMLEADQRRACLEHIEQLEKKFPQRTYLEMRKASLLRQLGRGDEADALLKDLLHRDATNPVAWAEAVFLVLDREDQEFRVAVELLQRAIDASAEDFPREVLEAIALVSQYAHALGMPLVCLKHMLLYLKHDPDARNAYLALLRFEQSPRISPLIKDAGYLPELAKDELPAEAAAAFGALSKAVESGRLRSSERRLAELAAEHPDSPTLCHSLALVRGWLGDNALAVAELRRLSALEIPFQEAIEAEALAQVLDDDEQEMIDVVEVEFAASDLEATRKTLTETRQVQDLHGEVTAAGNSPPPRGLAILLDRPSPASVIDVPFDQVPAMTARLAYFGKEVDRPARVNLIVQEDRLDEARKSLLDLAGGSLSEIPAGDVPEGEEPKARRSAAGHRVVGQVSRYAAPFLERKFVPDNTPPERRYEIIQDDRRYKLLNVWPKEALPPLGDKSPEQAAEGSELERVRLAAVILNMEIASQRESVSANAFDELRQNLNVPVPAPLPDEPVQEMALVRLSRLEPSSLSDDDLLSAFMRVVTRRYPPGVVKLGQELLQRPSLTTGPNSVSPEEICGQIAELSEDTRIALEWNAQAREFALAAGSSCAGNDLFELYLRVNRGEPEDTVRLLQHLMDKHHSEPGVRNAVAQVLYETGLMNQDGTMVRGGEQAIVTPDGGAEPGKIWTPEAEAAAASGGQSKIWLPE